MSLTIDQVSKALDMIEQQMKDGHDVAVLDTELKALRRWSNTTMMELSSIGNRLLELKGKLIMKMKVEE